MEKKTIDNIDYNYELYTQIENLKIIKEWISDIGILLRKIEKMDINNIQKQLEEAYQRGYKACMQENDFDSPCTSCEAYQRGLKDGKEYKEKGCEGCKWEDKEYNICTTYHNSYKNLYERKDTDDEIKVGDEVITPDGTHFVVFEVEGYFGDDTVGTFMLFGKNNSFVDIKAGCFSHSTTLIAKTGRHFEIDKILKEMKK